MRRGWLLAVLTVLAVSGAAYSQTHLALNGVGGKIGLVFPEGPIGSAVGLGLEAELGTVTPDLAVKAFLDFWSNGYEDEEIQHRTTQVSMGAVGKYYFEPIQELLPYAGAGLALNIGWFSHTGPPHFHGHWESGSYSDVDIGIQIVGGAEMPLTPTMDGFGELKYSIDGADYFSIMAGVIFKIAPATGKATWGK